jgi:hypothetical protein
VTASSSSIRDPFAPLQALTFFVAIAADDFPLLISIIFSLLVIFAIIVVTLWRRRRLVTAHP